MTADELRSIAHDPVALTAKLITFDTTNPPGNERACVEWIRDLLTSHGIESELLHAGDPERPNLLARLPGAGTAPPLLLYGHVDVVPTAGQAWDVPPFAGERRDGQVWGRGALDMKGGIAMLLHAFLRLKREGTVPPGDLLLAILADEETGGDKGAAFLVEQHPERFAGIRHAIGEFGGFTLHLAGKRFYPIQVGEKQICQVRATFRAPGGHASMPYRGGALAALSDLLERLDGATLPWRVTPVVERFFSGMAEACPPPLSDALRAALDPQTGPSALAAVGPMGPLLEAMLRNTINATVVRTATDKVNVIPGAVTVEMDARLLPGCTPEDLAEDLRGHTGYAVAFGGGPTPVPGYPKTTVEWEILRAELSPASEADLALFEMLSGVLREADPEGIPLPFLVPGGTDGRHFARLGIQTYGFLPMTLPAEIPFLGLLHAANERIPEDALRFGAEAVYRAIKVPR
jgi:acetylornithine deacetylase/succinyl-diaminopimelate desuccinylase-like protein